MLKTRGKFDLKEGYFLKNQANKSIVMVYFSEGGANIFNQLLEQGVNLFLMGSILSF